VADFAYQPYGYAYQGWGEFAYQYAVDPNAFQCGVFDPTVFDTNCPTDTSVIRNFSLREWRRWHKPEHRRCLEELDLEPDAADVIADVAERQVQDLHLDEQQRFDELKGEMLLRGIEMQTKHLEALNRERELLLNAEIGERLKKLSDERDAMIMLMLIAASS
jgi:hypothetical protein